MTQAFPLQWPAQRPRRAAATRKAARFGKTGPQGFLVNLTVATARERLQAELDLIGARLPVLSTNIELRLDGLPRSGRSDPTDPGVAVYFTLKGKPHCLPCDTYTKVADNIAAVAAHIKATREIERHGVASVAEMFAGFQALPHPDSIPWWQILQVPQTATRAEIEAAFRRLARERHPDMPGGSDAMMSDLNRARDAALKECAQ